jgi:hypothetical protein
MRGKEAWKKMTKRLEVQRAPAPLEEYAKHFEKLFGKSKKPRRVSALCGRSLTAQPATQDLDGMNHYRAAGGSRASPSATAAVVSLGVGLG